MDVKENSQQQEEQVDVFDLLPDAIVLEIFNRVQDARSLSACTVLCKRFGDLVTQTEDVSLQIIARRNTTFQDLSKGHINKSKAGGFLGKYVLKPVNDFLRRMVSRKPKPCGCEDEEEDNAFRLPNELLKNFKEVKSLAIKLPGHQGDVSMDGSSGGALLKWKAEFGKELESCVLLGATGFKKSETSMKEATKGKEEDVVSTMNHVNNLTNKQLKKRVVWTISCLIACSARHHMLKQIISANRLLRNVKITDGSKQGTIDMTERQVFDVRNDTMLSEKTSVVEMERTKVPAVTIKMWYMPELVLAESGGVMKGATLAVIRPATTTGEKEDDVSLAMGAFEDKFVKEAVKKLVEKKKSYTLEMNSF